MRNCSSPQVGTYVACRHVLLGCRTEGLPFLGGEDTADLRHFRYRPLDALTEDWRLHGLRK